MSANQDYGDAGHGLGRRQEPVSIPDRLQPSDIPAPATGVSGPPISVDQIPDSYAKLRTQVDELARRLAIENRPDFVAGTASVQLDADGAGFMDVYAVAAGMEARLNRLVGTAINPSTGNAYTPASTYSNAAGYMWLHVGDAATNDGVSAKNGSVLDFGPPVAGGPIFPFLFTDNSMQSAFVRGPQRFVLHIVSGPASSMVICRYQIRLERQKGIV